MSNQSSSDAREAILSSVRHHLAESAIHEESCGDGHEQPGANEIESASLATEARDLSVVELFRRQLESVGGHCSVARDEVEATCLLTRILADLQSGSARPKRIALSDSPYVLRVMTSVAIDGDELATCPRAEELFDYDVGISSAQAGIAETGTLVLESEREHHRLVSLLPPVHIAILNAKDIRRTLGEALNFLRRDGEKMSRAITFITGPSRTADIELTLTIGVHGPKELHVILIDGS